MADTTTSALNWATVENGKVKTTTSKKSDESNNGTMGYDQFLTLLCAEMQYQDPLEPTSNTGILQTVHIIICNPADCNNRNRHAFCNRGKRFTAHILEIGRAHV